MTNGSIRSRSQCRRATAADHCLICGVAWSGSLWPDLIVGAGIAALFLRTAFSVLGESLGELGRIRAPHTTGS